MFVPLRERRNQQSLPRSQQDGFVAQVVVVRVRIPSKPEFFPLASFLHFH